MSNKKKRLNINPADKFFSEPDENKALGTPNTQQAQHEQHVHNTQYIQREQSVQKPTNKKGQKLPRINIAFTHQNLDYLRRISKLEDVSITQYVNNLIYIDMNARIEDLEEAEKVLEKAKQILKGV